MLKLLIIFFVMAFIGVLGGMAYYLYKYLKHTVSTRSVSFNEAATKIASLGLKDYPVTATLNDEIFRIYGATTITYNSTTKQFIVKTEKTAPVFIKSCFGYWYTDNAPEGLALVARYMVFMYYREMVLPSSAVADLCDITKKADKLIVREQL